MAKIKRLAVLSADKNFFWDLKNLFETEGKGGRKRGRETLMCKRNIDQMPTRPNQGPGHNPGTYPDWIKAGAPSSVGQGPTSQSCLFCCCCFFKDLRMLLNNRNTYPAGANANWSHHWEHSLELSTSIRKVTPHDLIPREMKYIPGLPKDMHSHNIVTLFIIFPNSKQWKYHQK